MLGESVKPIDRVIDPESIKQITSSMKRRASVKRIRVHGWIPEVFAVLHKPSRTWICRNLDGCPFPQLMNREEANSVLDRIREKAINVFEYDIMTWNLPEGL